MQDVPAKQVQSLDAVDDGRAHSCKDFSRVCTLESDLDSTVPNEGRRGRAQSLPTARASSAPRATGWPQAKPGAGAPPWTARTAQGWENSPTQTGGGAMAAGRDESPEPNVLALILSPSSSDEEPD